MKFFVATILTKGKREEIKNFGETKVFFYFLHAFYPTSRLWNIAMANANIAVV